MKFFTFLCSILSFLLSVEASAQWCIDLPATITEIEACNNNIAKTFAPHLLQFANTCESEGSFGKADRITKANWDNDWIATNSWQSFEQFSANNSGWDNRPFCYFAVTWTPEIWIIVYSFYYPKDWAASERSKRLCLSATA